MSPATITGGSPTPPRAAGAYSHVNIKWAKPALQLSPNDTGKNGVCNVVPPPGEWLKISLCWFMLVRYCTAVALKRHEGMNAFNLVARPICLSISTCSEILNNLSGYKVVISMNRPMSRFYFPQWRLLMCQWNTRCNDAISIHRSINLIIDYFNFNRLIVAALPQNSPLSSTPPTIKS